VELTAKIKEESYVLYFELLFSFHALCYPLPLKRLASFCYLAHLWYLGMISRKNPCNMK